MKKLIMTMVAAVALSGCNAASVDLALDAYTGCLDAAVGNAEGPRRARAMAVQKAFEQCAPQEGALLAASAEQLGADAAAKAVADGKTAYSRRVVSAR